MVRKEGDFIPPDGGWGWMVVFAVGFSNLSTFPVMQQFGLLFRDRFAGLGITSSETTTIINVNAALVSCVGLINGPVFKTFSYRQVSLTGTIVIFTSLMCTMFSYNFVTYLAALSILYGTGFGIVSSANALALNTYWKKRRRLATAFSWTITGLGPIIWPLFITVLIEFYTENGTVLLLAGFSLHAILCALLLHPVEWHTKKTDKENAEEKLINVDLKQDLYFTTETERLESVDLNKTSFLSNQYCYKQNCMENNYEITNPGTPTIAKYNDGYFSKVNSSRRSRTSSSGEEFEIESSTKLQKNLSIENLQTPSSYNPNVSNNTSVFGDIDDRKCFEFKDRNKNKTRDTHFEDDLNVERLKNVHRKKKVDANQNSNEENLTFCQKVTIYFDLDLFKDYTFINLMLGITLSNFSEVNFSILTPFILGDFGLTKPQVALFMSLLAGVDLCVRFCVPFVTSKIDWDNDTFFLLGVLLMALGRIVLAYFQIYEVMLLVSVIIGFGKGLRTVFMALVIPTHVPLHKLAGATGIQLLTAGVVYLSLGPVVGYIKGNASTSVTLHCLNIFTWLTTISWSLEKYVRKRMQRKTTEVNAVNIRDSLKC